MMTRRGPWLASGLGLLRLQPRYVFAITLARATSFQACCIRWRAVITIGCFAILQALLISFSLFTQRVIAQQPLVLNPDDYEHYVNRFNATDNEVVVNAISNSQSWNWMLQQVPWLDCPSERLEEIYYYRWWSYRKHIKQTPQGRVLTEFLTPVSHAGAYNTIACDVGHHLAEGRWLQDQLFLDEYVRFWFHSGPHESPAAHFHKFSSWIAAALYDRFLVTGEKAALVALLDDLIRDYRAWESERQLPNEMYWQLDVMDGMEESISGSRREHNIRPTINCYMAANAKAIGQIAILADRQDVSTEFFHKAQRLQKLINEQLWDKEAEFYKVQLPDGSLSTAREAIGFLPWTFELAPLQYEKAWLQVKDPCGFWAPKGLTTAERRHPLFRTHGTGRCEWDGPVWPFATCQTLVGMANLLRMPGQATLQNSDYFEQLLIYAESHALHGTAYIGEYHDELTGKWLVRESKSARSHHYNHSTFCDLIISGLVGIVPQPIGKLRVEPLLPQSTWPWFCLDDVSYQGHRVTILWDRMGTRYRLGAGLIIFVDGKQVSHSSDLRTHQIDLESL